MRFAVAAAVALAVVVGSLVISPDRPPPTQTELPDYLKANLTADNRYELIKGPPWPFHVTAVLGTAARSVTVIITDKAEPALAPLLSVSFKPTHNGTLLLAQAEATTAATFAANRPYVVKLVVGKKVIAISELTLRE
jgi:hypothetical protein